MSTQANQQNQHTCRRVWAGTLLQTVASLCWLATAECRPLYSSQALTKPLQVLDNPALDAIASQQLGHANPTVDQMNSLAALAMAATTATLRFPGATLLPIPLLDCLSLSMHQPSLAP